MASNPQQKIAIVGMGALFPEAKNIHEFWQNIISKKVSIRPLPPELFESEIFYRPELFSALNKEDKSITNIAAWIDNLKFDTVRKYKIPPSVAEHMDANQHAALYTTDEALQMNSLKEVPKDRIGVIFGNGMVGVSYGDALARVQFQMVEYYLKKSTEFRKLPEGEQKAVVEYVRANALKDSIPITEDSAPGVLPNIIAARIASVYDFHGPSFTVDAACASVLAAIITGVQGLTLGEYDAVICGGADMPLKQLGFIYFSALNALSPDGSYPFDKRANGFVMGQGGGTVILKRLEDALKNKDTIYAVLTGYGETSDGKGKYIAAPNEEWQAKSIEKACRMAGYTVDTIELIEAHGTATIVGDVVEINGLKKAFANLGSSKKNFCGLTSVKSNIGHLKSAAGIAGFIKAVLALHHKILPPTANFKEINPKLQLEDSPFYIIDRVREWPSAQEHPRRANVSAFGFGGANYHVALQEFRAEDYHTVYGKGFETKVLKEISEEETNQPQTELPANQLVFFSAHTLAELKVKIDDFKESFSKDPALHFSEYCTLYSYKASAAEKVRLALLISSPDDVLSKYEFFSTNLEKANATLLRSKGIFFRQGIPVKTSNIAVMFPGQASQYLNMLRAVYQQYNQVQQLYQQADAFWYSGHHQTISELVFPKVVNEEALESLKQTQNAHPAIFTSSYALYHLIKSWGLSAGYMIGHSLGEITALAAAEKLSFEEALRLIEQRGFAFYNAELPDTGKMISILATFRQVEQLIKESGLEVKIANINSPKQIIVAGGSEAIDQFKKFLDSRKVTNKLLFVSHAFHSPLMESVAKSFYNNIKKMTFRKSKVKVIMNHSGNYYPNEAKNISKIPQLLQDQILQPVDFVRSIEKLYTEGVRLFVEIGPNSILSSLCKEILKEKEAEVSILASNYKNGDDLDSLQKLMAALFAEGVPVKPVSFKRNKPSLQIASEQFGSPSGLDKPMGQQISAVKSESSKLTVVYSGVSVGLPGSYKAAFRDDNFDQIFEGRNFIERITDQERQKLVDLQITKLVKDERGPTFKLLTSLEEVIQLAGKIGKIDLIRDYHFDDKDLQSITTCISLGVAAGYEALRDAHIPLIREYSKTSTGKLLPQKLALPENMQEETGIIFANGFPMIDPVIEEVSRYISYYYGSKTRKELMAFYESIIERVKDHDSKKLLTDWYTLYYQRLNNNPGVSDIYQFNYHFMNQISAQANNRLASLINAKGPNFQMNAACSSTSNAITIAEDFIRSGRVKRMIVVGADDPTSPTNFPWLGAGFLCTGAATNEGDLYKAAIPFDRRRNGMIISAGAVGIVLETKDEVENRGLAGVCELLGTHSFNTASHPSQIDTQQFSRELHKFISRMEQEYHLNRADLSKETIYISHETYTPPRGGCSQTEAEALKKTFAENYKNLIIGNTKGMTGHTMGAALEDAVAAKALQFGKVPPVVNYSDPDPILAGLNLSEGGTHQRIYALKMSAGFGSQGHFALLKKCVSGQNRILDNTKYLTWLRNIAADEKVSTEDYGRLWIIKDKHLVHKDSVSEEPDSRKPKEEQIYITPKQQDITVLKPVKNKSILAKEIIQIIAEMTEYPEEMLESDMEMEADLGIDAVRQEKIYRKIADNYRLPLADLSIAKDATLGNLIDLVYKSTSSKIQEKEPTPLPKTVPVMSGKVDKEIIKQETLKVFAEITKYPEDMLDLDMEMEADLGIDTVKQATILSILGEKYLLKRDENLQLSNYPTIGHIVDLIYENSGTADLRLIESTPAEPKAEAVPQNDLKESIKQETLQVFSEVTKYPQDMLDLDMEMEADLGIDTVKQATILSILGEKYRIERDEGLQLSNYPTIGHIVDFIYQKSGTGTWIPQEQAMTEGQSREEQLSEKVLPEFGNEATEEVTFLSRQVIVLKEEPLQTKEFDLENKTVWIWGQNEEILRMVSGELAKKKAKPEIFLIDKFAEDKEFKKRFSDFAEDKTVDLIIDCAHLGNRIEFNKLSESEARDLLLLNSQTRFIIYKYLSENRHRPSKIICLTAIDGVMGVSHHGHKITDPSFGVLGGFYKALRKEWPDCQVKIVDFAPELVSSDTDKFINYLISEIEKEGIGIEIAYPQDKRMVVKIEDKQLSGRAKLTFSEKDTFLVSGGGSGITAQIIQAIARRYPANFIILDIVELPDNISSLAQLDDAGLEQMKQEIRQRLQNQKVKITPVVLNSEFEKISKAIEVHNNIMKLRDFAHQVEYYNCDVRDYQKLKTVLSEARPKLGNITGIIHAAGVEKSHPIAQKSLKEFQQVFTVKAQGAYNLMDLCQDEPLRLLVTFSSISGRFGNAAQLDYSAANSFLSLWVKFMQQNHKNLHALSLIWSGWKDVGMAWRNEFVRQKSEEMGLNFIEVRDGISAFLSEIETRSNDQEVILHKGLAGFAEPGLAVTDLSAFPLIDRVVKKQGQIGKAFRVFSVHRDALIDQHRLGKVPILPAVAYSELAVEYYALQTGKKDHYILRDLTFTNAFKLFREEARELFIEGHPVKGQEAWKIEVKSDFRLPKTEEIQTVLHSQSTVSSELGDFREMHPQNWKLESEKVISLAPEESLLLIKNSGPEQRIILGPLYNDVVRDSKAKEPVLIYPNSTIYPTYFPQEQLRNDKYPLPLLFTNPCFLDSLYQACAAHLLVNKKRVYLPWAVKELAIIQAPRQPGLYKSYTKVVDDSDEFVSFYVSMIDGHGQICYYARNATFRKINL